MQRHINEKRNRKQARQDVPLEKREELRQCEIVKHPRFAVFGRTFWHEAIAAGLIPSRKYPGKGGGGGARVVRVADLVAFLEQSAGAAP